MVVVNDLSSGERKFPLSILSLRDAAASILAPGGVAHT